MQYAFLENSRAYFAVAVTAYLETAAECVDCLDADTVQTNALFECLAVVFTAGIQFADCLYQLSLRNASSVVAYAYAEIFFYVDFDSFAGTHLEFIDTVVHYLFQQYIDTVIILRTVAKTAEAIAVAAPMEITVVPAQGGMGGGVSTQANTVAERFAQKLGGYYRFLHLPDGLSGAAADELARLPQVREPLELVRHADVLLYGIGRAMDLAQRRGLSRVEQETLREEGAVAEALGFYLSADGRVVGGGSSLAFKPEDIGRKNRAAAVAAGRAKAEAILAVCAHHPHKLLVVDEGAALRMIEFLRR